MKNLFYKKKKARSLKTTPQHNFLGTNSNQSCMVHFVWRGWEREGASSLWPPSKGPPYLYLFFDTHILLGYKINTCLQERVNILRERTTIWTNLLCKEKPWVFFFFFKTLIHFALPMEETTTILPIGLE
jgi:hypothetical protein